MTTNYIQGPLRAVDVLDALAWEDSRQADRAARQGTSGTPAYYCAWQLLSAWMLNNPAPQFSFTGGELARLAMRDVQTCRTHRLASDR